MHQSWMPPIQWSYTLAQRSGKKRIGAGASEPSWATQAFDASTLGYLRNHCSLRRGSMGTSARSLKPTLLV